MWPHKNLKQDVKDIDLVQQIQSISGNMKEKWQTERRCFACDKREHLKRNCPTPRKETMSKAVQCVPKGDVTHIEQGWGLDPSMPIDVNDMTIKLKGMSIAERDKVIDTLLRQKGFLKNPRQAIMPKTYRQSNMVYI